MKRGVAYALMEDFAACSYNGAKQYQLIIGGQDHGIIVTSSVTVGILLPPQR